jgi:FkbM family methyltransferase
MIDSAAMWPFRPKPRSARYIRCMLAAQHIDVAEAEQYLTPSDGVVVDVGAEEGEVSEHFLERGYRVYACEPEPRNFAILKCLKGLKAIQVACSDTTAVGHLELSSSSWAHRLGEKGRPVELVRLADLLAQHSLTEVALLKVDTEGHETQVLDGLFRYSAVRPKLLMVEFTRETLRDILSHLPPDYRHFRVLCRTSERPTSTQIRLGVYDGLDPAIYDADWGNLLAALRPFRVT